jgi:protein SCO1/2
MNIRNRFLQAFLAVLCLLGKSAFAAAAELPRSPSQPSMASASLTPLPGDSIYRLPIALTDQAGKDSHLADRRGAPQLVSMFYTSCQYVCTLIIDTMKKTQRALSAGEQAQLKVLLVSFDPERDSAARLAEVFAERKLDTVSWTLACTDASSVRKLAAVLGVQYRALDAQGRIVARTDKLGDVDPEFVAALHEALGADSRIYPRGS